MHVVYGYCEYLAGTLYTEQLRCVEKHPNRPLIQTKNETTDGRGRAKRGKKNTYMSQRANRDKNP